MKKYIGFLIVLSLFVLGARETNAINIVNPSTAGCTTGPTAGLILTSLDVNTPAGMTVVAGTNNVEVLRIDLSNIGTQKVCLNGIQLGSSSNLNNFITNTKVIDVNTGLQVGQIVYSYANNGSYYYSWVNTNPSLSIKIGETKIFKVVSDFPTTAQEGVFKVGSWGLNFDLPGAPAGPQVVNGNKITVVNNPTVAPTIKVTSPNGGENYITGQQITIKWNTTGIPASEKVMIVLDPSPETNAMGQDGYNMSGSDGTLNDGIETHTLSSGVYGKFKVRVLQLNNKNIKDVSDDYFTITPLVSSDCPSTASPSVTVLSPNGGEVYQAGQSIEVKWKSCNSPSPLVLIGLWSSVLSEGTELATTQNDGKEIIILPTYMGQGNPPLASGNYYKIGIELGGSPNLSDKSDNTFTINSLPISSMLPAGCNSSVGYSATNGLPCFIDTNPATSITKNSAVLNGRLIANAPSDVYFKYKKAGNWNEMLYTHKTSQQTNGLFAHTLSNLLPSTSYEFMVCTDYLGAKRCSKLLTFTTLSSSEIQEEEVVVDQKLIYPAGCSSSEGYSYITGVKCSGNCSVSGAGCGVGAASSMVRKTLKQGIKDEEVKILQSFLNIKADGSFGPQTANAVKLFQTQKGLIPDGVVGPKTWTFINK